MCSGKTPNTMELTEPTTPLVQPPSPEQPNKLSQTAKLLEDEQARLRICQGKLKHAKEDFDRAERDTKDAEDSVEGLRRQLQELIAE